MVCRQQQFQHALCRQCTKWHTACQQEVRRRSHVKTLQMPGPRLGDSSCSLSPPPHDMSGLCNVTPQPHSQTLLTDAQYVQFKGCCRSPVHACRVPTVLSINACNMRTTSRSNRMETIVLGSDCEDEDSQHDKAVRTITNNSWLSTDHLTFWGELLNAQADDQQLLFCAARPLHGLHGSIGSLGFASHANNKLFIMPFQHRSHFFLVGVQRGIVRYYLDPMSMALRSLNAFQKSSIRSIQSALDGCTPCFDRIATGAAAWKQLLGQCLGSAGVQPQWQNAAAGDGYNCGVFCCMYMWEILHHKPWHGGDVANFRQHVAVLLDCWWQPSPKRRRLRSNAI